MGRTLDRFTYSSNWCPAITMHRIGKKKQPPMDFYNVLSIHEKSFWCHSPQVFPFGITWCEKTGLESPGLPSSVTKLWGLTSNFGWNTWYMSDIYCQLGDYILPTTFYKNLINPLRLGFKVIPSPDLKANLGATASAGGFQTLTLARRARDMLLRQDGDARKVLGLVSGMFFFHGNL